MYRKNQFEIKELKEIIVKEVKELSCINEVLIENSDEVLIVKDNFADEFKEVK